MPVVEAIVTKLRECGVLTPGDFSIPGPGRGATASVVFATSAIPLPYLPQIAIVTTDGCVFGHTFPLITALGFALELSTQDIASLTEVIWCAEQT